MNTNKETGEKVPTAVDGEPTTKQDATGASGGEGGGRKGPCNQPSRRVARRWGKAAGGQGRSGSTMGKGGGVGGGAMYASVCEDRNKSPPADRCSPTPSASSSRTQVISVALSREGFPAVGAWAKGGERRQEVKAGQARQWGGAAALGAGRCMLLFVRTGTSPLRLTDVRPRPRRRRAGRRSYRSHRRGRVSPPWGHGRRVASSPLPASSMTVGWRLPTRSLRPREGGPNTSGAAKKTISRPVVVVRKRGRSPTTGEYVGITKAREERLKIQREEGEYLAVQAINNTRLTSALSLLGTEEEEGVTHVTTADLVTSAREATEAILEVSKISGG